MKQECQQTFICRSCAKCNTACAGRVPRPDLSPSALVTLKLQHCSGHAALVANFDWSCHPQGLLESMC
jgi:hypothetical protein